ncbi:NUDIX domain-containing protein [Phyllobacterium sp. SB3]|uniref:NUDIX domain-containing protein n=1 Tax=Phyllobacterium sp. SB3 TaxID=3156073 RepID=UPI0032AF6EA1
MNSPGVGCGLVFLKDAHILLLQRKKSPEAGSWGIPGGKVDFLEIAEHAVRREALEETGLSAGTISLLGISEQLFHEEQQHWLGVLFLAEDFSGEVQLLEPEKHDGIDWFSLENLPDLLTLPTKHALDLIRQHAG